MLLHPYADTLYMVTTKLPQLGNTCVKVVPGRWFSTGVPSPKFQTVLFKVTLAGAVEWSVKLAAEPSQTGVIKENLAVAVSNTIMVLLIVSTQPPAVEVNVYLIKCVPTPAIAGLNIPVEETPVPEKTNVPGTPPISLTCAGVI